jgi:hypothetical protein
LKIEWRIVERTKEGRKQNLELPRRKWQLNEWLYYPILYREKIKTQANMLELEVIHNGWSDLAGAGSIGLLISVCKM